MIQILPMAQEHISALAELERQCFADPWSEQALAEELSNPNAVFRVALIDGEVAGYVGMLHVLDEGDICNVAVFDRFRRKGVATALIDHLLNYGREKTLSWRSSRASRAPSPAQADTVRCGSARGRPISRRVCCCVT